MRISIKHLRAAGVTDTQIVNALQEAEAKRREQNRIAQRNHRSRQQNNADSADCADIADTNIEERKIEERKEVSIPRASRAKKPMTPLPENWHPELAGDIEFQKFCDHARAKARLCADWEAALRNWNRNAPKFNGGQNGRGRRHGSVLDAFDRLGERLKAAGATDDYVPGSSGPRPLELDTPVRPANLRLVPPR